MNIDHDENYITWLKQQGVKWHHERDEARAERDAVIELVGPIIEQLEAENAALRRELEALKRRLPVWFDIGHNETDQREDGEK